MAFPDGPRQSPPVQLARWIFRPIPFMEECFRRYGDMFALRMTGLGEAIFVCSPELIREVFSADPEVLYAGQSNEILRPLLGNHSLLLLDGAEHLRERRMLLPPFHGERMQAYATLMRDLTEAELARWPTGRPFRLHPRMQAITLEVILRAVFGLEEGGQAKELGERIVRLLAFDSPVLTLAPDSLKKDFPLSPYRRFLRLKAAVDELIFQVIDERRRAPGDGRTDILSLLFSARDEEGRRMTDMGLRDELLTLLLAGHETSATALAWVIERLMVEPQARERVEAELDAVLGGGRLEPAHLPKLEYLDAVIKEVLRLRPIIPVVGRRVMKEFTLGGQRIPPGWRVMPCIYLAHRRPQTYPEPERFRPERFLEAKADPYAWLPFGGGVRRCLGMAFALYEIKVVLATLLSRVRLRLTHPGGERVVRRQILFAPKWGTEVVVTGPAPAGARPS